MSKKTSILPRFKVAEPSQAKSKPVVKSPNVTFNQTLDGHTYERLVKCKRERGMLRDQDVMRIAIVHFLTSVGY